MDLSNVLSQIKACFLNFGTKEDKRAKIQASDFLGALICGFGKKDARVRSLNTLRKSVMELTGKILSRGSFWERMATKKLTKQLQLLLSSFMSELCVKLKIGQTILDLLSVTKIFLLDSSSITLPPEAKGDFPAPRSNVIPAAIKVHALWDLFGGIVKWFNLTPATTHDRKGFPPLDMLVGALIIFDLGYWDYQLLKNMKDLGIFFLSRVKTTAKIKIVNVVSGVSRTCIGFDLHSQRLMGFRGNIVEVIGQFIIQKTGETFESRVIGFWNPNDTEYYWYVTNLKVSSILIYPLYRLRWQLELLWKSWKGCLVMDEITSANRNIILNLTLTGMCSSMISGAISISVLNNESEEIQSANSVQRAASIFVRIGAKLFHFISGKIRGSKEKLMETIDLFKNEFFDPNYNKRVGSLKRVFLGVVETS